MSKKYILSIDQGTTGSRAFIFNSDGRVVASAYKEFKQYFPKPGWVEHDAQEIWASCTSVIKRVLEESKIRQQELLAIGITNQRETTVVWDRKTSKPLARAIVWQCRRTSNLCDTLRRRKTSSMIQKKTGLLLDPYFSGTKIKWLLDNVSGLRKKAVRGRACFGTIDSWLIWKLTNGESHTTDFTNASRTLLFNIKTMKWDPELLKMLGIPPQILPMPKRSGSIFGYTKKNTAGLISGIPIAAVMGDQQAALYGQGCHAPGTVKNTYGTGCFLVLNTGKKLVYSKDGLLTTVACDAKGQPIYALEGAIFIAGAVVQWLRDGLGIIKSSAETEAVIKDLKDTNGVYLVPAFTGLGAPYWRSDARGLISGLTRGTNAKHIVRASLEAIAYQTKDVFDIMQKSYGKSIREIKVDGGACRNNFLMQFQSDMLKAKIIRPKMVDSTAQGVAHLAGVTVGLWKGKKDLKRLHKKDRIFNPSMKANQRKILYDGWLKAVKKTIS